MKHIRVYEDFSVDNQMNEAAVKEITLPGGFININYDDSNAEEGAQLKKDVVYFQTNTTTPDKNLGSPNSLDVSIQRGNSNTILSFPSDNYYDEDRKITMKTTDYKKLAGGGGDGTPNILAKDANEATAKAYEILASATYLTPNPAEPKVVGDMIRAFFEIRKLYPAYMSKNALLKGFLQGLISGFSNPNFGEYAKYDAWSRNVKDRKYNDDIRKALTDVGALKSAS